MNESYWDRWQVRRLGRRPLLAAELARTAAVAVACSIAKYNNVAQPAASPVARQPIGLMREWGG